MRVIKEIPIDNIKVDRFAIQPKTLDLVDYLRNGGSVPPIHIYRQNGTFILCDGRHRLTAFKLLGRNEIMARFYDG